MRVLIVHNRSNPALPSGEDVVVSRDARALEHLGVEVIVHRAHGREDRTTLLGQAKTGASLLWSRSGSAQIRSLVAEYRPDIVHFHGVLPDLSASVFGAASQAGARVVQTLHNHRWLCVEGGLLRDGELCRRCITDSMLAAIRYRCVQGSRFKSAALVANNLLHVSSGRLHRVVDHFVAVSEYVRDRHLEGGFPPDRLSVKYNNVEIRPPLETRQHSRAEPPARAAKQPRLIFVGRLDRGKGADLLPAIFARVPNAHLDIVGVGDLRDSLRQEFGPQSTRVSFHGRLDSAAVHDLIAAATLALIPSRAAETFGLVAAEAMAAATPFICSDRGALAELATKSEGGRAVELGVEKLARAAQTILESPTLAATLGENGRGFAERELSLERGGLRLLEIYRALTKRN